MKTRLPAEWERQDGIILPWPHPGTDWADMLTKVEPVFLEMARAISRFEPVLIIAPDTAGLADKLAAAGVVMEHVRLYDIETDDTWARDFGPVTVYRNGQALPLDFRFNGWGNKFSSELDNMVTRRLGELGLFAARKPRVVAMVLEGGSIDSDGNGSLLTTSRCLLNDNRNPGMNLGDITATLCDSLGIDRILWLESGVLMGDDTDSHVDILARFAPGNTILHVSCNDRTDPHYPELEAMQRELATFRTKDGLPYRLLPLPLPNAKYDRHGNRLAATYANFLVINSAVLVPAYNDPNDRQACDTIAKAFPGREIVAIDATPLIFQGGSLHCSTMHLPEGALA